MATNSEGDSVVVEDASGSYYAEVWLPWHSGYFGSGEAVLLASAIKEAGR